LALKTVERLSDLNDREAVSALKFLAAAVCELSQEEALAIVGRTLFATPTPYFALRHLVELIAAADERWEPGVFQEIKKPLADMLAIAWNERARGSRGGDRLP
jgi:hypothetical protein